MKNLSVLSGVRYGIKDVNSTLYAIRNDNNIDAIKVREKMVIPGKSLKKYRLHSYDIINGFFIYENSYIRKITVMDNDGDILEVFEISEDDISKNGIFCPLSERILCCRDVVYVCITLKDNIMDEFEVEYLVLKTDPLLRILRQRDEN